MAKTRKRLCKNSAVDFEEPLTKIRKLKSRYSNRTRTSNSDTGSRKTIENACTCANLVTRASARGNGSRSKSRSDSGFVSLETISLESDHTCRCNKHGQVKHNSHKGSVGNVSRSNLNYDSRSGVRISQVRVSADSAYGSEICDEDDAIIVSESDSREIDTPDAGPESPWFSETGVPGRGYFSSVSVMWSRSLIIC